MCLSFFWRECRALFILGVNIPFHCLYAYLTALISYGLSISIVLTSIKSNVNKGSHHFVLQNRKYFGNFVAFT